MARTDLFEVEREGEVLILTPQADLREFEYRDIEARGRGILDLAGTEGITGVVLDFSRTDFYGSTALAFFVRLWRRVSGRGGRMAFCNVSEDEREILAVTRLDSLWPVCQSREEALKAVRR
jgi:stage II sporulation protein AA (anti-sigma F factor antagonist)